MRAYKLCWEVTSLSHTPPHQSFALHLKQVLEHIPGNLTDWPHDTIFLKLSAAHDVAFAAVDKRGGAKFNSFFIIDIIIQLRANALSQEERERKKERGHNIFLYIYKISNYFLDNIFEINWKDFYRKY